MIDKDLATNLNHSNKFLFLDGYGMDLRVDDGKLLIRDGTGSKQMFFPKRFPFDNVIVYGTRGSISFEAIRWLIKHNAQISVINWNGKLLTSILPQEAKQTKLKFRQYEVYKSQERIWIARNFIDAKLKRTNDVLDWLKERYPKISYNLKESSGLNKAKTILEIMNIEGRIAKIYWQQFSKIFDKKFNFITRQYTNRPVGAVDPINALFNYGYALLEAECRKAINSVGMDTHVGFLHEVTLGSESLVYDLQEPFRWLIDVAVINSMENKTFDKKDFIRTENYNMRLRPSGAKKLIKEVERQFNKKTSYLGMEYSWHYIILLKARELGQYLMEKRKTLKFSEPNVRLNRNDSHELREKIIDLSYSEGKKIGIGKGSLWYMKRNAMSDKPFKVYGKVKERLMV